MLFVRFALVLAVFGAVASANEETVASQVEQTGEQAKEAVPAAAEQTAKTAGSLVQSLGGNLANLVKVAGNSGKEAFEKTKPAMELVGGDIKEGVKQAQGQIESVAKKVAENQHVKQAQEQAEATVKKIAAHPAIASAQGHAKSAVKRVQPYVSKGVETIKGVVGGAKKHLFSRKKSAAPKAEEEPTAAQE